MNAIENDRYNPGLRLAFDIAAVFASRIEDIFRRASDHQKEWSSAMIVIPDTLAAGDAILRPDRSSDLPSFQRFASYPESTRFMAFTPEQKTPEEL